MRPISEWQREAICKNVDPEIFFTGQGINPTAARKLCPQCPVQSDCLDYALLYDERGVWGGKTQKERKSLAFLRSSLRKTAQSLGILENRQSLEDAPKLKVVQAQVEDSELSALASFDLLADEPTQEQLMEACDPTAHVQVFPVAM